MRSVLLLIATAALCPAQVSAPQILTVPEIQFFEADVAQNPSDLSKARLLGQNYAFQILGVTALSNYGSVTHFDPQVSSSAFAAHCRQVLETSTNPTVLGEGASALWNARDGGVGAMLPRDVRTAEGTFAEQTLSRAIAIDGTQSAWRTLRIFMAVSDANFAGVSYDRAYAQAKSDLAALSGDARYYALAKVSELAYKAGNTDDAAALASELVSGAKNRKADWNSGNAVHAGNMVLGEVALHHGDVAAAQALLLAAGATAGSPQLNSFGPNMSLARDLLQAGDRKTVLQYFEECRAFWKMGGAKLDEWTKDVNAGNTPKFGANLVY